VDSVRAGIVVEVGIIGIEKDSTASVEAGIIDDEVSVVEEGSGVGRACSKDIFSPINLVIC
jgi:hypothetical protein